MKRTKQEVNLEIQTTIEEIKEAADRFRDAEHQYWTLNSKLHELEDELEEAEE